MFREILFNENVKLYEKYYKKATFKMIYHNPYHLLAEEKAENYNIYVYIYEEKEQFVILPSIKRCINDLEVFKQEDKKYFDLVTPYEYSGVLSNEYDLELFKKFYKELKQFCVSNNIIFQFIRFNPYSEEYKAAKRFQIQFIDSQNWVNCKEDALQYFQKRKARYVKAAIKNGLTCREVEKNEENIKIFYKYYIKAMDRLQARTFLYFNYEYFLNLLKCEFAKLFFVLDSLNKQILSGIIVLCDTYNKRLYHHLSFKNTEIGNIHSMEYMVYATFEWAKVHGYESMHLGGGSLKLHQFKDGCTDKRIAYYCGNIIYQPQIYQIFSDKYFEKYPEEKKSMYLPIYRSKE